MKKNKFMAILTILLISISSIANSSRREAEFGVRINFISLVTIEKIKDIDFGDIYIDDVKQSMKSSGEFKIEGPNNLEIKFKVPQNQILRNGNNKIIVKTYASDEEDGGETKSTKLSGTGEFHGYLVAELENVQNVELGEYTGTVNLVIEYD